MQPKLTTQIRRYPLTGSSCQISCVLFRLGGDLSARCEDPRHSLQWGCRTRSTVFSCRASRCHALRCRVHAPCYCTICTLSRPRRVLAPVQCFACEVRWQPSGGRIDMDIPRSRGRLPADFPVPDDLHILVRCFPKTGPARIHRISGVFCQGVSTGILLLNNLHHNLYHPPAQLPKGASLNRRLRSPSSSQNTQ